MALKKGTAIIDIDDLKGIWRALLKNWIVILAALILAGISSYFYMHKITKVYAARTQMLLKSSKVYDYQSQLLQGLGNYYDNYENISNQIRVLKSANLIDETISKLNLDVSYFILGRLNTTEIYNYMPFTVNPIIYNPSFYEKEINMVIIDSNSYRLSYKKDDNLIVSEHQFGEPVLNSDFFFDIKINGNLNEKSIMGLKNLNYMFKCRNRNTLIAKYKSALEIINEKWTAVLDISVTDEVSERAVSFLDTLTSVYIDYTLQSKKDISDNTVIHIDNQLDEIIGILTNIEDDLEIFKKERSILDLDREESEYFRMMLKYEEDRRNLIDQVNSLESLEKYILNNKVLEEKLLPPYFYISQTDEFLKSSLKELYGIQMQRSTNLYNMTEISPGISAIDRNSEELRKNILIYIINAKKAVNQKIEELNFNISKYERVIGSIPQKERQMLNINRKLQVNEKMYLYLLEKKANTIIARAGIIPESTIIEKATPMGVVRPNKQNILNSFLAGGMILSMIIIFFRTAFFDTIDTVDELKTVTDMPIIGEIIKSGDTKDYGIVDPSHKTAIVESFRSIRANLEYMNTANSSCKKIVLTSYGSGEGKTYCSINLATILAYSGKKVLLAEFDLHKPKISGALKITNEKGVSSILAGKCSPEEAVCKLDIENLDVILSGPTPPNAPELMLGGHIDDLYNYAEQNYDYLIIDTPPVGLLTDAMILMRRADINLYVLRAKDAKKESVIKAIEMKETNNFKNMALMLNAVKISQSKYYYAYSYSYGYGYRDNAKAEKKEEG